MTGNLAALVDTGLGELECVREWDVSLDDDGDTAEIQYSPVESWAGDAGRARSLSRVLGVLANAVDFADDPPERFDVTLTGGSEPVAWFVDREWLVRWLAGEWSVERVLQAVVDANDSLRATDGPEVSA